MFVSKALRKIFEPRRKLLETGKNYRIRCFVISTPNQLILE
jgi:hypothetical protein